MEGIWAVPWEKVVVRKENLSQRVMATTSQRQVESLLGYRNRIGHRTRGRDNGWRGFIRLNECFWKPWWAQLYIYLFMTMCGEHKGPKHLQTKYHKFSPGNSAGKIFGIVQGRSRSPEPTNRGPLSTCKSGKDSLQPSGIKSPRICR